MGEKIQFVQDTKLIKRAKFRNAEKFIDRHQCVHKLANITIPAKCSAYIRRLSCGFPLHFVLCLELFSSSIKTLGQHMASNWRVCIFRIGEHEATPSVPAL